MIIKPSCSFFHIPVDVDLSFTIYLLLSGILSKAVLSKTPCFQKKSKIYKWCMGISLISALILFIRCGWSYTLLKGTLLMSVYLFSSVSDIKTRNVPDVLSVILLLIGCIDVSVKELIFNGLAATATFGFFLMCAIISKNKIGGADMKMIAGSVFVLGTKRGVTGLIIGLAASVVGTLIRNKKTKSKDKTLPMIPYLSAGFFTATIL